MSRITASALAAAATILLGGVAHAAGSPVAIVQTGTPGANNGVVIKDSAGVVLPYGSPVGVLPGLGATSVNNASGNVANATATATLAGTVGKTTYMTGFSITGAGATAGACVSPTITGLIGGTMTYTYCVPTGATLAATSITQDWSTPLPASGQNVPIVVTVPAVGAGNTNTTATARGLQQ